MHQVVRMDYGRTRRGDHTMHHAVATVLRRRGHSQNNVGNQEKSEGKLDKPVDGGNLHIDPDTSAQVVRPEVIRQNLNKNADRSSRIFLLCA
jgi:hypothetical protein